MVRTRVNTRPILYLGGTLVVGVLGYFGSIGLLSSLQGACVTPASRDKLRRQIQSNEFNSDIAVDE
jgi:hypothetical protein